MIVPKSTITKFLNRKLRDCRAYKKLTDNAMLLYRDQLPTRPPIWDKLKRHQRACFLLGAKFKRFAFLLDTGCGKTLLSISLIRYFRKIKVVNRALVLVPARPNKKEWSDELRKHSPSSKFLILSGSSKNKWEQLQNTDADFIIETYAGLIRMVCKKVPHKKKARNKLKPQPALIKRILQCGVNALIMDESTYAKTKNRLPYRVCRKLAQGSGVVFALTGTPFGRDPEDLWAQFYLVDGGETLGSTLGMFRAAFFNEKRNHFSAFPDYVFNKHREKDLYRMLANRSVEYEASEADLPKLVPIIKEIRLPKDTQALVNEAKETLRASHGNYIEVKNAFLKMRQLSSGFLGYEDDDLGVRAQYEFKPNPKLEMLLEIINSIPEGRKIIIFHEFTFSGSIICRELEKMKRNHVRIYGKTKDVDAELTKFKTDPACQILVLQNAVGGFGLNLQVAQYGIYYESPVSPIIRKQTRRRFERQHSEHATVFQYDLVVKNTYDARILKFIEEGQNLFDAIVRGKR